MTDCLLKGSVGDLDPYFLKALKIMQSNKPTAADELYQMYLDSCMQKRGDGDSDESAMKSKLSLQKKETTNIKRKDDFEKVFPEKIKQDSSKEADTMKSNIDDILPSIDTSSDEESDDNALPGNKSAGLSKDKRSEPASKKRKISSDSDTEVSDNDKEVNDLDDLQIDLDIGSLSCVVCKSLSLTPTNRLVECQECHSLYHQECHKPPITENVNDPRFVWYCVKCAKNMKKIASKVIIKKPKLSTSPSPGSSGNGSGTVSIPRASPTPFTKAATIEMKQNAAAMSSLSLTLIQQPFKRLDTLKPIAPKDSTVTKGFTGNPPMKDLVLKSKINQDSAKVGSQLKPNKNAADQPNCKDNSSNSSSGSNSSSSHAAVKGSSDGRNITSQRATTKGITAPISSFSSAIGGSASTSSLTFSGSLARLGLESSSGVKKVPVVKNVDKR